MTAELALKAREGAAERCPYCHDCLEGGLIVDVQITCQGCGTSHHQACFAELGGCTVMGCSGGGAAPEGSLEEIRERIRARVGRFVARNAQPPEEGVRERLAAHWICADCGQEFPNRSCSLCEAALAPDCEGTRRHCPICGPRPDEVTLGQALREALGLGPGQEQRAKQRRLALALIFLTFLVTLGIAIVFSLI